MKSKEQKREEGQERKVEWLALDLSQKVQALLRRPGKCKRQLAKLQGER